TIAAASTTSTQGGTRPPPNTPKLTPRFHTRTRLKTGRTGIDRGGSMTQTRITHLLTWSSTTTRVATASPNRIGHSLLGRGSAQVGYRISAATAQRRVHRIAADVRQALPAPLASRRLRRARHDR